MAVRVTNLTTIASDDDAYPGAPGGFSQIIQAVRSNTVYHIAVDGFNGASGTIKLAYSFVPAAVCRLAVGNTAGGTVGLSISNAVGSVPSVTDVRSNSLVTLTATPAANYQFDSWDGSLTSQANPLTIIVQSNMNLTANFIPVQVTDDFESGGLQHINWTVTGPAVGNASWFVQSNVVFAGQFAARSGVIADSQTSSLLLTNSFAAGNGSFDYRVSSESDWDLLSFYVDGVLLQQWSGEVGWANYMFPLTAGTHTLEWTYSKDASLSAGLDAAFIDNVNLPMVSVDLKTFSQDTFSVNVLCPTNQQVIIQMSTNLVDWQNIATNLPASSFFRLLEPAGKTDQMRFYRALVP